MGRREDELLVRVGPYRRALLLPDSLRRRPVVAAAMQGGRLEVRFGTSGRQVDDAGGAGGRRTSG